jgi:hypothetical protein
MFKIEKGIPQNIKSMRMQYPFDKMDVGDSFLVKGGEQGMKARSAAGNWGKVNGKKFSTRKVGDDYRVWRTA